MNASAFSSSPSSSFFPLSSSIVLVILSAHSEDKCGRQ